jgi:hypothetical protein
LVADLPIVSRHDATLTTAGLPPVEQLRKMGEYTPPAHKDPTYTPPAPGDLVTVRCSVLDVTFLRGCYWNLQYGSERVRVRVRVRVREFTIR